MRTACPLTRLLRREHLILFLGGSQTNRSGAMNAILSAFGALNDCAPYGLAHTLTHPESRLDNARKPPTPPPADVKTNLPLCRRLAYHRCTERVLIAG
jgi:hypothetical protein